MGIVYRSPERMWDTWVFKNDQDFHLFFLSRGNIGRAVSTNLIHWKHLPPIENMAKPGDWDESGMRMTGSVTKVGSRYFLCYGSGEGTPIGLIVSDDLYSWKRVGDKPVLPSAPPYATGEGWRDLSCYFDEEKSLWNGYLYGIDGASGNPSIAHVTTADFITWNYLPPAFVSETYTRTNDGFYNLEVPDYFQLGEKHYLLFSSVSARKEVTSGRKDASGIWYLTADDPKGPWRVPPNPLLMGSGLGRYDVYVGRTVEYRGNRLLYHQTWGLGKTCWGTPKLIKQTTSGDLILAFWPDLDTLKTGAQFHKPLITSEPTPYMSATGIMIHRARSLELFGPDVSDMMLECKVDLSQAKSATLVWHHQPGNQSIATGLKMVPQESVFQMVRLEYLESVAKFKSDTFNTYIRDDYTDPSMISTEISVRIISRAHQVEVYINDIWVFSMDVSDLPSDGGFGLLAENGAAAVRDLTIFSLEPLETATDTPG